MIKCIPTNLTDVGMENYLQLDKEAPDGVAKEIVGHLAWKEELEKWDDGGELVRLEKELREVFKLETTEQKG